MKGREGEGNDGRKEERKGRSEGRREEGEAAMLMGHVHHRQGWAVAVPVLVHASQVRSHRHRPPHALQSCGSSRHAAPGSLLSTYSCNSE